MTPDRGPSGLPHRAAGIGAFDVAGIALAAAGALGLALRLVVIRAGLDVPAPERYNVFYFLYARDEAPMMAILVAAGVLTLLSRRFRPFRMPAPKPRGALLFAGLLAVLVAAGARVGERYAMHDYGLSADEFAAEFQSKIFARGRATSDVPAAFRPCAGALVTPFVGWDAKDGRWLSKYMPVYAAIRAVFERAGGGRWTNPVLAGASIVLVALVARRLWPSGAGEAALAAGFLAVSSQFLLMSMSGYAYPAHLCANLLWLWLWLRDDRIGWALLPWVGVAALGLHNPVVHAAFVAPFLVAIATARPRARAAYVIGVYALGAGAWLAWLIHREALLPPWYHDKLALPGLYQLFFQTMQATLIFSWQAPIVGILLVVAIVRIRRFEPPVRLIAASAGLTFAVYLFYPLNQAHGWGYRYVYGVLGTMVLLAVAAFRPSPGFRTTPRAIFAVGVLAAAIQIPLRLRQADRVVGPFARVVEIERRRPEEVVAVDAKAFWYAGDIVRNDPDAANRPVFVRWDWLGPAQKRALTAAFGSKLRFASPEDARRAGIPGS
ncbi:MAG TPA: hypothetical protein VG777_02240 [Thermoanaerobaculia bacterium]|nr:hypothetical protein [Thermoanaerobaculia bacterium]